MPRFAYVNGNYLPLADAQVSIEDRGYQFADGLYEVCLVVDGKLWDADGHFARWDRSLKELDIAAPVAPRALRAIIGNLLRRNRLSNALVYMQATRGVGPRNHVFPKTGTPSALVVTAKPFNLAAADATAAKGVAAITAPDIRWGRVDIKSVSLLPNVLARQAAKKAGAAEAILVRDGVVTEGAASNVWIVDDNGALVTHPLGTDILGGITRATTIDCAQELQIRVREDAFTLADMKRAREVFITAATNLVMPVVTIDGAPVGDGAPGPVARTLRDTYKEIARARAAAV